MTWNPLAFAKKEIASVAGALIASGMIGAESALGASAAQVNIQELSNAQTAREGAL